MKHFSKSVVLLGAFAILTFGATSAEAADPTITSIAPNFTRELQGVHFSIMPVYEFQVNGTNFVNGSVVYFNNQALDGNVAGFLPGNQLGRGRTFHVSPTVLNVKMAPGGYLAFINAYPVKVVNPDGKTSNIVNYNVVAPLPGSPTIRRMSVEGTILNNPGDITIEITGVGFVEGCVVGFGGAERSTTYVSPTQVRVTLPRSDFTVAGDYIINVFNPGGLASNPAEFAVIDFRPQRPAQLGFLGGAEDAVVSTDIEATDSYLAVNLAEALVGIIQSEEDISEVQLELRVLQENLDQFIENSGASLSTNVPDAIIETFQSVKNKLLGVFKSF